MDNPNVNRCPDSMKSTAPSSEPVRLRRAASSAQKRRLPGDVAGCVLYTRPGKR